MRTFNNGIFLAVFACLAVSFLTVEAVPLALEPDAVPKTRVSRSVTNELEAQDYLKYYNYMTADEDMWASVMYFQRMAGIQQTGIVDEETMEMMNMPRCGNTERMGSDDKTRRRRYDAVRKWPSNTITWRVNSFTDDLSRTDTVDIIDRALQIWSGEANLQFTQITGREDVDFNIEFIGGRRAHTGDQRYDSPFDGRGQTLAHAFLPNGDPRPGLSGDAHFDDDELFTQNTNSGVDLFQVAAHEFGHSLGLGHSDVRDALMYPFYRGYIPNYQLHSDDIAGIRTLYGPKGQPMEPVTANPDAGQSEPNCPGNGMDAFVSTNDGESFALKDNLIWRVPNTVDGYPKQISEVFAQLPSNVDAGLLYLSNGFTYFFKGSQCYEYSGTNFQRSYLIADKWPGLPNNIDAAFVWGKNGRTYFMKGNQYYRFNDQMRSVDQTYPRPLSVWNLPITSVDAAFQYKGRTYFFSGDDFYQFDDNTVAVAVVRSNPYPRSIARVVLGCNPESYVQDGRGTGNQVVATSATLLTVASFFITLLW